MKTRWICPDVHPRIRGGYLHVCYDMGMVRGPNGGELEPMTVRVLQDIAESLTRLMLLTAAVVVLVFAGLALFFTHKGD